MKCPRCDGECTRDEVDIGVGVMTGPWCCESCGWTPTEPADDLLIDDDSEPT